MAKRKPAAIERLEKSKPLNWIRALLDGPKPFIRQDKHHLIAVLECGMIRVEVSCLVTSRQIGVAVSRKSD